MIDLAPYNTLHLPSKSQKFITINTIEDIKDVPDENIIFLGDGANVLFKSPLINNIAKINLKGIKILSQDNEFVTIQVASGESWHNLVTWSVQNNYSGIENMALIPGTTGAAAIGNIAAYGQNQEDVFLSLHAINFSSGNEESFNQNDMKFGYRDSIFKHSPTKYLITDVTYRLSKTAHLELSYHAQRHASLLPTLKQIANEPYTIQDVYDAIVKIRTEKLPDPKKVGTAGSFFKNPLISKSLYLELKNKLKDFQGYPPEKLTYTDESQWLENVQSVKIPAGRLLDELGWKGKRIGNVGTYPTHALTVVAYPGATGQEVYEFAESMRSDILKNFNINLEYEVVRI